MNLPKSQTCPAATSPVPLHAQCRGSGGIPAFPGKVRAKVATLREQCADEPVRLQPNSTPPLNNISVFPKQCQYLLDQQVRLAPPRDARSVRDTVSTTRNRARS